MVVYIGGGGSTSDGFGPQLRLTGLYGLVYDGVSGSIYFSDATGRIRLINIATQMVTTLAGSIVQGTQGYNGDTPDASVAGGELATLLVGPQGLQKWRDHLFFIDGSLIR